MEFFLEGEGGEKGPLTPDAIRGLLGPASTARIRADGCETWLAAEAWEALADLRPVPQAPIPPAVDPPAELPQGLAGIPPSVRDKLLWFVADRDGIMGPVSGEFVRRGLASSKIKMGTPIAVVSTDVWVRASVAFPRALEGATMLRPRQLVTFPCPACLEPCAVGDTECLACGERVRSVEPPLTRVRVGSVVLGTWLTVMALSLIVGLWVRACAASRSHEAGPSAQPSR